MNKITDILAKRSAETPDRELFHFLGPNTEILSSLTCGQTFAKAQSLAASFKSQGLAGQTCILMYQPGLEVITAFFGCLYAGVIAVPAFPLRNNSSAQRVRNIIADSGATAICTTRKVYNSVSKLFAADATLSNIRWIFTDEVADVATDLVSHQSEMNDVAYLQYTSGSTSSPKGVMITHDNIVSNLEAIDEFCKHTPDSRIVSWMPVFHDMGLVYGVLQPIFNGCVSYLMPPMLVMQDPFEWLNAISTFRANYSTGPNFAFDYCIEQISDEKKNKLDLSTWIAAGCAAEPVNPTTLANFAERFKSAGFAPQAFAPCYGLAECTLKVSGVSIDETVTYLNADAAKLADNKIELSNIAKPVNLVGCGKPSEKTIVKIVDPETHIECNADSVGEIWVKGPSVAAGFWNKPEESEYTFNGTIANANEGGFLRTGDLGFLHNGEVFVTGRLKELIIIRGSNHYPQDIEHTIKNSHFALKNEFGAAFSAETNHGEELVVVYEINNSIIADTIVIDKVIKAVNEAVFQEHGVRVYDIAFIRSGTLPKTSSGKIQRVACKQAYGSRSLKNILHASAKYHAENQVEMPVKGIPITQPVNMEDVDMESWLITNLAQILSLPEDEIENDEPFASYGLDSSVAAGLTGKINEQFGLEVEPTVFWEYSNVDNLSKYLNKLLDEVKIS